MWKRWRNWLASVTMLCAAPLQAEPVTLTVHHFLSPSAPAHAELIKPWTERLQKASDGQLRFEIFPSMAMGGKPPELYRQVRDGAADIVWTLTSYTPGVFPRTEVFELPTVHQGSAEATNRAIEAMFSEIAADYDDIVPLLVHVHSGNALLVREEPVMELADVQGRKIRTPGRTGAQLLTAWGAEPVGMPISALPQAMAKGGVDGALMPFEVAASLKVPELVDYAVEGPQGQRFGTSVFLLAMNKDRFDSLPEDLQQLILDNSGQALAGQIGAIWDDLERRGGELLLEAGAPVHQLTPQAMIDFNRAAEKVVQQWIRDAKQRGIDGAALVRQAREAVDAHTHAE